MNRFFYFSRLLIKYLYDDIRKHFSTYIVECKKIDKRRLGDIELSIDNSISNSHKRLLKRAMDNVVNKKYHNYKTYKIIKKIKI